MKRKIKKISLAFAVAALVGAGAATTINLYNANATSELFFPENYTVESEYVFGDTFIVYDPARVQIETGTLVTNAISVVLECPDGSAKSEGEYTLDKTGTYRLTYYNANGVSATHSFVVNKMFYETGEGSTAKYMESLSCKDSVDGISVSLKSGESFSFNKAINLKDYADSLLDVCKIYPKFRKEYDMEPAATTLSVKIMDCYDASKFVEFYVWCGSAGNNPYYAGAGASTQVLTGFEQNRTRPQEMTEEYNGEMYKIHRPRRYQSRVTYGRWLSSRDDTEIAKHDGISLIWDLSNHQMKAQNGSTTYLITDIDSPEVYGVNTFDFASFFTTGEVIFNIEAYNYAASSFDVEVESIFGMSGSELLDGKVTDKRAPEISVDVETTTGNTIYLAKGKKVTLPKIASVLDYNYYGDSSVSVYRNYGKRGQVSIKVQDGGFIPDAIGNYTAVYTAIDSYGNRGEYLVDMVVLDERNIAYESVSVQKLVAAKTNIIPYSSATGLNKQVVTSLYITEPNGEQVELEYNAVVGYEYFPKYAGEYTVTYCFKDNVYEETYSYKVACVDENAVAFINPFNFSSYFMKGATYTLDAVSAYTAGNYNLKENQATVSVSVDGGAYQILSATQMQSYTVEASQTLQFKASYQNSEVESKVYSVVDVGYGKKTTQKDYLQHFQGNYTSAALSENGAIYAFAEETANLQFINKISSANFKLNFTLSATSIQDLTVILRDAANFDNYITLTYQKEGNANVTFTAKQYVEKKLVSEGSAYTSRKEWNASYSLVYTALGLNVDGVLLEGIKAFEKDAMLLEICATGLENATIGVMQLNNQTFTETIRESKPQMTFEQKNGVQEANSTYTIDPCYASSVFGSVLSKDIKVTVTSPTGEIVTTVDGIRLESVTADRIYKVQLTQVGQYRVSYTVSCLGSTRTNAQTTLENEDYYIVNVSEGVAPTITFKDGSTMYTTIQLKVGETHKVKDFVATDNTTATENLKVYKMILDDHFMVEENGYNVDSYTFVNVGKFIVYVLVYDELGNSSVNYYNVIVS